MKISNNWLGEYLNTDLKIERIGEILTDIGLEVEGIEPFETIKGSLQGIVVGQVMTCEKHPNADKLKVTTIDVGAQSLLSIVCGAPNVEAGQKVAVATVGTKIYAKDGSFFEIKKAKLRGEVSEGMLCSQVELGVGEDHSGIMVLEEDLYEVGKPLSDYIEVGSDHVYEIGLTPNRTDAMSHYGVARDLHAYLASNSQKSDFEKLAPQPMEGQNESDLEIVVEDSTLTPRYVGAFVENVTIEASPEWLQNRLLAIGLSPINNVVDITNYILHGLGQPLHAFDADKIEGHKVKVGTLAKGTKFTTLDGVERSLSGEEIMIKDGSDNPMCIAGVFGGMNSGVGEETQRIFLESAYFNPVAVRKAAKYHGLSTDASFRFERGVDPAQTKTALSYAIKLIEEIAGGQLVGEVIDLYPSVIEGQYVVLRYSMLDQILGIKIHREKVKEILKSLDIAILNEIQNGLELSVPTFRADVTREIDVIEEILRIYGYNKVESPAKFSFSPVKLSTNDQDELENSWARTLQSAGFNEVMNNSLTSIKDPKDAVKLLNPLSGELAYLRTSLLEGLLQNAAYNINRKSADLKFFELGKIYHKTKSYSERKQLALLTTGKDQAENWRSQGEVSDFYRLKGYVSLLLQRLGLKWEEEVLEDARFSDGLALKVGNQIVARLGIVSKEALKSADVDQKCYYAEIELQLAQSLRETENLKFQDLPKFNVIRRDLALLVDKNVSYSELKKAVEKKPSRYLRKVNLFDVYEGKNLPEGKKSYALSFELLNEEKTLEEKEISQVMNQLIALFENEFGATLR
ncbi:phenylalanine--tRNA ligase subunit beta [Chryseobacterium sp. A321]